MAIKDYGVQPLFAEPLFRADIGHAITPDQVEFIKNLKMINNKKITIMTHNKYMHITENSQYSKLTIIVKDDSLYPFTKIEKGVKEFVSWYKYFYNFD